ncbi:MAG: hypothetical protein E6778_16690 [Niallia nealsonii]|nr:hypothetical protein A499_05710 [Niallia nealsonii AAU1]MDU1847173.1 hypothetical protein [Niallia nealsonii]
MIIKKHIIITLIFIMSVLNLVACSNSKINSKTENEFIEMQQLKEENQKLKEQLTLIKLQNELLPKIQELSYYFFKSMSEGKFEEVRKIMVHDNTIDNKGNIIFSIDGQNTEYLFDNFDIRQNEYPKLRFFLMNSEDEFTIGYTYFLDNNVEEFVLNLTFIKVGEQWKLNGLYKDK